MFKSYLNDFVNAGLQSWEELTKTYKKACRETHPDLGGNHESFLKIQEEYQQALQIIDYKEKQQLRNEKALQNELEELLIEGGYPSTVDLRSNFYFLFDLYYRFSLYDLTIRSSTPLQSRNGRVLKTLLLFGAKYDAEFGERFVNFHENRMINFSTTPQARTWSSCKNDFWTGWQYFFRFQAEGRAASKRVSIYYWEETLRRLERAKIDNTALENMTIWFLNELEKSPVHFEI